MIDRVVRPVVIRVAGERERAADAAVEQYLRAANKLERDALIADHESRFGDARELAKTARRVRAAAKAELTDPRPDGLER